MKAIVNGFSFIINLFKTIFSIIMNLFKTIGMLFQYLITIINIAITTIATLPPWLRAFAILTISISTIYIIVGRNTGKSD